MPASIEDIVAELDELLEAGAFADYCPNGLQVPGRAEVGTVATGVSAHLELFGEARSVGAELIVVHHGIFWGSGPLALDGAMKARLKTLFDADMSLAAYHLPLDAHPTLGNNALIARGLGATSLTPFALHRDRTIGFLADFPAEGIEAGELFAGVAALTGREPLVFDAGPQRVRRLGIVSGGGSDYLADAIGAGADAFLTGEPTERVMAEAREAQVHYIAAGHYATETFGVRRLGDHLAERFGLRHVFIDVPNPV